MWPGQGWVEPFVFVGGVIGEMGVVCPLLVTARSLRTASASSSPECPGRSAAAHSSPCPAATSAPTTPLQPLDAPPPQTATRHPPTASAAPARPRHCRPSSSPRSSPTVSGVITGRENSLGLSLQPLGQLGQPGFKLFQSLRDLRLFSRPRSPRTTTPPTPSPPLKKRTCPSRRHSTSPSGQPIPRTGRAVPSRVVILSASDLGSGSTTSEISEVDPF